MNFRSHSTYEEPEINLIPFIDVLLVIVIFLMISTTFNRFAELKVDLPNAQAKVAQERQNELIVSVTAKGYYSVNGLAVPIASANELAQALVKSAQQKHLTDPSINIYADANTTHQSVVNIMEAARVAGFGKIVFSTKK